MKIKASIGSPLYEIKHFYGKPAPVKRIKEGCKKNLLLSITVEDTNSSAGKEIYDKIFSELKTICKDAELMTLSECDWAKPLSAEEAEEMEKFSFKDSICIPKDFDQLEVQKKELLKTVRTIIRRIKEEYKKAAKQEGCEVSTRDSSPCSFMNNTNETYTIKEIENRVETSMEVQYAGTYNPTYDPADSSNEFEKLWQSLFGTEQETVIVKPSRRKKKASRAKKDTFFIETGDLFSLFDII